MARSTRNGNQINHVVKTNKRAWRSLAAFMALALITFAVFGIRSINNANKVDASCEAVEKTTELVKDVILQLGEVLGTPPDTVTPEEQKIYDERFAPLIRQAKC
jgi:hypothetical protein